MTRPAWQPRFYLMERQAYGRIVFCVIDSDHGNAVRARCDDREYAGRIAGLLNREEDSK